MNAAAVTGMICCTCSAADCFHSLIAIAMLPCRRMLSVLNILYTHLQNEGKNIATTLQRQVKLHPLPTTLLTAMCYGSYRTFCLAVDH